MYVALIKKVYKEEFCMTEGEVIEAVIFRLYFDLKNMTWSGKSQGKVREFFIVYLLATLYKPVRFPAPFVITIVGCHVLFSLNMFSYLSTYTLYLYYIPVWWQ